MKNKNSGSSHIFSSSRISPSTTLTIGKTPNQLRFVLATKPSAAKLLFIAILHWEIIPNK